MADAVSHPSAAPSSTTDRGSDHCGGIRDRARRSLPHGKQDSTENDSSEAFGSVRRGRLCASRRGQGGYGAGRGPLGDTASAVVVREVAGRI